MRKTESWIFASTTNQIQTSLARAYNLGVISDNTPWCLPRAAKEIGLTIAPDLLVRADKVIK